MCGASDLLVLSCRWRWPTSREPTSATPVKHPDSFIFCRHWGYDSAPDGCSPRAFGPLAESGGGPCDDGSHRNRSRRGRALGSGETKWSRRGRIWRGGAPRAGRRGEAEHLEPDVASPEPLSRMRRGRSPWSGQCGEAEPSSQTRRGQRLFSRGVDTTCKAKETGEIATAFCQTLKYRVDIYMHSQCKTFVRFNC